MTENFYRTRNYETDYSTFGGIIYNGDFDRCLSLSDMAARIESDFKFDKMCRLSAKNRERNRNYRKEN